MKKLFNSPLMGLPLLYLGVLLMVLHFSLHISSNLMLGAALCLELAGTALHYYKIKHPRL